MARMAVDVPADFQQFRAATEQFQFAFQQSQLRNKTRLDKLELALEGLQQNMDARFDEVLAKFSVFNSPSGSATQLMGTSVSVSLPSAPPMNEPEPRVSIPLKGGPVFTREKEAEKHPTDIIAWYLNRYQPKKNPDAVVEEKHVEDESHGSGSRISVGFSQQQVDQKADEKPPISLTVEAVPVSSLTSMPAAQTLVWQTEAVERSKEEADQKDAELLALLRNQQHNKHPVSQPLSSQPLLTLTTAPVGPFTHVHKTIQPEVLVSRNPRERKIWDPGITTSSNQHLEDKVFLGRGVMI